MRGKILVNGNIQTHEALIERAKPWILGAAPQGRPPRVLLVTAAWGGNEYGEGGLKAALNRTGVPSVFRGGYDHNIQNLCVWHQREAILARRPDVAAVWSELQETQEATRQFYMERTTFHADALRRGAAFARERLTGFSLGALAESPQAMMRPAESLQGVELLERAMSQELNHTLSALRANDARMLGVLSEAEDLLLNRTGLRFDPAWRQARADLEARMLGADALLFLGGNPVWLLESLRFFDLRPALVESLRRGALFVAVSAGALLLCERIIIYNERSADPEARDFRLLDTGMGLVGGLQIMPHCMDRIHTDDAENLAYLARRFSAHVCAGLNQESFLLLDFAAQTATSVGAGDGVYIFGRDGQKRRYDNGQVIPMATR